MSFPCHHAGNEGVSWLDRATRSLGRGIDTPSVDPFDSTDLLAHHVLLDRRMTWIEGLDLDGIGGGAYELLALPVALRGTEAAPVRAVLRRLSWSRRLWAARDVAATTARRRRRRGRARAC